MLTFATFAVGLAARPIGGIIFGYIGDRYSRKKMLAVTMLLMSVPTFCIGLLPTYEKIGLMAPIILISLRVIQGVALGGEFGASCVYLYESAPAGRRGLFGTLALTGVGTGLVMSSCTIFIIESIFTPDEIFAYAWRIPFFISVAGAMIGLYMRRALLETEDFEKAKEQNLLLSNPLKEMVSNHKSTMIKLFSIFLTTQISFFVVFIFGKSMMIEFLHFSPEVAGKFNLFTVMSYTVSTVIFGYLSDKIDKKYIILFGIVGIFLAAYPFIASLKAENTGPILMMSILLGALIGMTEGTLNPLVAESFPTEIRATSVAFCWNFTSIAFGAVSPIIAMLLIEKSGIESVAYYLMSVCVLSAAGILKIISLRTTSSLRVATQ
jgi:MFS family permease